MDSDMADRMGVDLPLEEGEGNLLLGGSCLHHHLLSRIGRRLGLHRSLHARNHFARLGRAGRCGSLDSAVLRHCATTLPDWLWERDGEAAETNRQGDLGDARGTHLALFCEGLGSRYGNEEARTRLLDDQRLDQEAENDQRSK